MEDPHLVEVWCESQDDITLIWEAAPGSESVEYVQVKGQMSRAWSVAFLCSAEAAEEEESDLDGADSKKKNSAPSALPETIVEKLMANDRSNDGVDISFRLVVRNRSLGDIAPLLAKIGEPSRASTNPAYHTMCGKFIDKLSHAISPNKHDVLYWIERTWIECVGDEMSLLAVTTQKLNRIVYHFHGEPLTPEQIDAFYKEFVRLAFDAGKAEDTNAKRWTKSQLRAWFEEKLTEISQIVSVAPQTGFLFEKMRDAGISTHYTNAYAQRLEFRRWKRSPTYMSTVDSLEVQAMVSGELLSLMLGLEMAKDKPGIEFFQKCLQRLSELGKVISKQKSVSLPGTILNGCMYDQAGRCGHNWGKLT